MKAYMSPRLESNNNLREARKAMSQSLSSWVSRWLGVPMTMCPASFQGTCSSRIWRRAALVKAGTPLLRQASLETCKVRTHFFQMKLKSKVSERQASSALSTTTFSIPLQRLSIVCQPRCLIKSHHGRGSPESSHPLPRSTQSLRLHQLKRLFHYLTLTLAWSS